MLEPNQIEMMYGVANFKVWTHVTCRRAGKTVGAMNVVLNTIIHPNSDAVVVSSTYPLTFHMLDTLKSQIPRTLISWYERDSLHLHNGSKVTFRPFIKTQTGVSFTDNLSNLKLVVYEEAGFIPGDKELHRYLNSKQVKVLITGTPSTLDHSLLQRGSINGKNPFMIEWGTKTYPWDEISYWRKHTEHFFNVKNGLSEEQFEREFNCK